MEVLVIVLYWMAFLMQPGFKPAGAGLQDHYFENFKHIFVLSQKIEFSYCCNQQIWEHFIL